MWAVLEVRLSETSQAWFRTAAKELAAGANTNRFCALFSAASRRARSVRASFTEAEFLRKFPLMAVMTMGGESFAVVGERTIGVGQVVEGFKLVSVQQRKAVFERDGSRVTLALTADP